VANRHPRIQVPRDPELDAAIRQGRKMVGAREPASRVVRLLALRGAAALEEDREAADRARDFLIAVADGSAGLDLERLRTVHERAWR
jgi:hypothetical protein